MTRPAHPVVRSTPRRSTTSCHRDRHRSTTRRCRGRHRSTTPRCRGRRRSTTPRCRGRHRSTTPRCRGRHRSTTRRCRRRGRGRRAGHQGHRARPEAAPRAAHRRPAAVRRRARVEPAPSIPRRSNTGQRHTNPNGTTIMRAAVFGVMIVLVIVVITGFAMWRSKRSSCRTDARTSSSRLSLTSLTVSTRSRNCSGVR